MHASPHDPVSANLEHVEHIEREAQRAASLGERVGLAVTNMVGTGWCAALHVTAFAAWIAWNSQAAARWRFDPYPFGLLTMWVSMEGVVIAILVLVTQNRMTRDSDRRDHLDLQVNLLAEQEMTMVLRMLLRLAERLEVHPDPEDARAAPGLTRPTDIRALMDQLQRRFG